MAMRKAFNGAVLAAAVLLGIMAVFWLAYRSQHATQRPSVRAGSAGAASPGPAEAEGRKPERPATPTPASISPRDAESRAPVQTSVAAPENDAETQRILASLADAATPEEGRRARIRALAAAGDERSVRALMAAGDADLYLNFAAVEALGSVTNPAVADYLAGKTHDRDPRVISAAVRGLASLRGAEAVDVIAKVLADNRRRPDGYEDVVCAACVDAFGTTRAPGAIATLAEELAETVGKTLDYDYGSKVVAALRSIGDAAAVPALKAYVARLQASQAAMADNPMGQQYLDTKIKESQEAAERLSTSASSQTGMADSTHSW